MAPTKVGKVSLHPGWPGCVGLLPAGGPGGRGVGFPWTSAQGSCPAVRGEPAKEAQAVSGTAVVFLSGENILGFLIFP